MAEIHPHSPGRPLSAHSSSGSFCLERNPVWKYFRHVRVQHLHRIFPSSSAYLTILTSTQCLFTFIVGAYLIVTPIKAPKLYNCWAALVLEIFGVIFWLSAFATMASWASLGLLTVGGIGGIRKRDAKKSKSSSSDDLFGSDTDWLGNSNRELEARYARYKAGWRCAGAAAGLGGIVW